MPSIGSILGLGMAGVLAMGVDADSSQSICMKRFKYIVYAQNGFFTVFSLLFLIFFKEKPEKPPSKLSLTFTLLAQRGILEDVVTLTKNRNFILNMVVFQIMYGTYVALGNTITPLLGPNGYTPS